MYVCMCLLSTLFVLTLTVCVRELPQWPSIADMSSQGHCDDEEDGCIGFSS